MTFYDVYVYTQTCIYFLFPKSELQTSMHVLNQIDTCLVTETFDIIILSTIPPYCTH